jgi:uncharacterized protein
VPDRRPDRSLGPGHDEFWEWCAVGELRLQRCGACGHLSWPAVAEACERCDSTDLTWERMSGLGTVVSACTFVTDYYRGAFPLPWDTILVELDEGSLFLSDPVAFGRDDIGPATRVAVTFVDCEDSAGAFRLPVFERA